MGDCWIHGDYYLIDDVTGLKIRHSDSTKQWDGLIVHKDDFETRHPQDYVKAKPESQSVRTPRSRPVDTFIGPLTTAILVAAVPGDSTIAIESSNRMVTGDRLSIMLDDGTTFRASIQSIIDPTHITLTTSLPWSAAVGMMIYDNTAMAIADVG